MRSILIQVLIVSFIGLTSWYAWDNWAYLSGQSNANQNTKKSERPPTSVDAKKVRKDTITIKMEVVGNLKASDAVDITTEVSGIIKNIEFQAGEIVEKDQILLVLDYKVEQAKLDNAIALTNLNNLELSRLETIKDSPSFEVKAARAALENAQAITHLTKLKLRRLEGLKSSPAFKVSKFEDLKSKMVALKANEAMAQANLNIALQNETLANYKAKYEDLKNKISALVANEKIAKANLNKKIIKAPFNGIVGLKNISVGEYLEPGEIAATLDATNPIELDFEVPESAISTLSIGTTITTYTRTWGEELFTGKIKSINSRVNKESRSITVRAQLDNPDNRLKPGMFMIVKLPIFIREEAIIIPEEAIISDGTQRTVYTIEEGMAKAKSVILGERLLGEVEVTNGLEETTIVIVGGIQKVRDGTRVIIRNKDK